MSPQLNMILRMVCVKILMLEPIGREQLHRHEQFIAWDWVSAAMQIVDLLKA